MSIADHQSTHLVATLWLPQTTQNCFSGAHNQLSCSWSCRFRTPLHDLHTCKISDVKKHGKCFTLKYDRIIPNDTQHAYEAHTSSILEARNQGPRKCWNTSYVLHTAQYSMNNKSPGVVSESRVPLPVSRLPYEAFHASSVDHIHRITCLYRS